MNQRCIILVISMGKKYITTENDCMYGYSPCGLSTSGINIGKF